VSQASGERTAGRDPLRRARHAPAGHAKEVPKPLVEIGGQPIVWHVIGLYAAHGFRRFLLATGHRGELIERFAAASTWPAGVSVTASIPAPRPTRRRIKLLEDRLAGEPLFCATYADGLADIDLAGLLAFHRGHEALATMTVVRRGCSSA